MLYDTSHCLCCQSAHFMANMDQIPKKCFFKGSGAFLGLLSGFSYALCGTFGKLLAGKANPVMLGWVCASSISCFGIITSLITKVQFKELTKKQVLLELGMSVLNILYLCVQYYAFILTDLSNAITLASTIPLFVALINIFIFRKKPDVIDTLIIIFSFLGVLFCTKPSFLFKASNVYTKQDFIGLALSLLVALIWAIFFFILSGLKEVNPFYSTFLCNILSTILIPIYLFPSDNFYVPSTYIYISYVVSLIVSNISAVMFGYMAVLVDSPLTASIGRTFDIVASRFIDYIFFSIQLDKYDFIGSTLIMSSVIVPTCITILKERYIVRENNFQYNEISDRNGIEDN